MASGLYELIPIPNTPVHFSLDDGNVAEWMYIDMALVHNVIIRGVNAMWTSAPSVAPADVRAFSGYALACLQLTHAHHHGEEEVVFPRMQAKLDMGHNLEQHDGFRAPMQAFEEYMTRVNTGLEEYDGERTREAIQAFGDPLVDHLREEITTIMPEKLSVFSNDELVVISKALEEHIKGVGHFFTIFPVLLTAHDKRDAPDWPPVPAPVKWFATNIAFFVNRRSPVTGSFLPTRDPANLKLTRSKLRK